MRVLIVHYTLYGHTHYLAEAIEEGAQEIEGAVVEMRRVPESLSSAEIERKREVSEFQKSFLTIPLCIKDYAMELGIQFQKREKTCGRQGLYLLYYVAERF